MVGLALLQPARTVRHRVLRLRSLMLHATGDTGQDIITVEYNGLLTDRRCAAAATPCHPCAGPTRTRAAHAAAAAAHTRLPGGGDCTTVRRCR